jgi:ketosteroid isomerase-like protein
MTALEVALAFVAAINAADVEAMGRLMTPDHRFVDGDGSEHGGRDEMVPGWRGYFEMVPDFRIDSRTEHWWFSSVGPAGRSFRTAS